MQACCFRFYFLLVTVNIFAGMVPSRQRQWARWNDSRELWTRWETRWTRGRRHQGSTQEGSGGCTRTTHCGIGQRVQGFHRALHPTSQQVEGGVGVRDRIVGGGSCSVGEVGCTTGNTSWGTDCRVRSFVHFATDGEPVAVGTRFVVTRIASESCIQGEAMVWGWTSRCQCNSPNARSPPGPRGVVKSQKLRVETHSNSVHQT